MGGRRSQSARCSTVAVLAWVLPGLSACVSFAPPIRAGHYGAPRRLGSEQGELGAGGVYGPEASGGGYLGYGISEQLAIEAGAESDPRRRAIGWAGLRYTPANGQGRSRALLLDMELGAGAGVGGTACDDEGCSSRTEDFKRPAGGGYLGVGLGAKLGWFRPWLRARTQLSAARSVPLTSFTKVVGGVGFSIRGLAHLHLGSGGYLVVNWNLRSAGWLLADAGLSFTIPAQRSGDRRRTRR